MPAPVDGRAFLPVALLSLAVISLVVAIARVPERPSSTAHPESTEWLNQRLGIVDAGSHDLVRLRAWEELSNRVADMAAGAMGAVGDSVWESVGPTGIWDGRFVPGAGPPSPWSFNGRLIALAVHPVNSDVVLVGSDGGGIWRTQDRGKTWQAVSNRLCSTVVYKLLFDPANPAIAYAASNCGVIRSLDAGQNWDLLYKVPLLPQQSNVALAVRDLVIDVQTAGSTRGTAILAVTSSEIHRSTDSGLNFTKVLSGGNGPTANPSIVQSTTNGGRFYALVRSGVYRSDDSGRNWQLLRQLPHAIQIAVSPTDGNTIYLTFAQGYLLPAEIAVSRDAGSSWEGWDSPESRWSGGRPTIVPLRDGSSVLYYGVSYFARQDSRWVSILEGNLHVDGHAAHLGDSTILLGHDGGLSEGTLNAARTSVSGWVGRNGNLSTVLTYPGLSVDPTDVNSIVVGLQDNGTALVRDGRGSILETSDGGWTVFLEENLLMIETQAPGGPRLCRRANGLFYCVPGKTGLDFTVSSFIPPMVGSASGEVYYGTSQVYRHRKGTVGVFPAPSPPAPEWEPLSDHFTYTSSQCGPATVTSRAAITALAARGGDRDLIVAGTRAGQILRSSDGGASWQSSETRMPCYQVNDVFIDGLTGVMFAAYARPSQFGQQNTPSDLGAVFRSTDGGKTWNNVTGDLPYLAAVSVAYEPTRRQLFVGNELGVYVSGPEGGKWLPAQDGMPVVLVQDLVLDSSRTLLYAGTWGRGVYRLRLPPQ